MAQGEIRRACFKHKVFGDVVVVEIDESGAVLAVSDPVTTADLCKHRLPEYPLSLDSEFAVNLKRHRVDWELFEPTCSDPVHQLHEIFEADRAVDAAEAEWQARADDAKAAKAVFEKALEHARNLRRELRDPRRLPLFEAQS
jgi:hypothetical protein